VSLGFGMTPVQRHLLTQAGAACKSIPIGDSGYCYVHHPDHAEERRRHGARGASVAAGAVRSPSSQGCRGALRS